MAQEMRLDVVVRVHERREQQALEALGQAERAAAAARLVESQARAASVAPTPKGADSFGWELHELSRERARAKLVLATAALRDAEGKVGQARTRLLEAHSRTESVRRALEGQREGARTEERRAESRQLDDLSLLRFATR
jgi:flagellar export protein FliJ